MQTAQHCTSYDRILSVRLSVSHSLVSCQNDSSYDHDFDCNVRKLHRPCMSDAFLADTVDTTVDYSLDIVVQHLRRSVNCTIS